MAVIEDRLLSENITTMENSLQNRWTWHMTTIYLDYCIYISSIIVEYLTQISSGIPGHL